MPCRRNDKEHKDCVSTNRNRSSTILGYNTGYPDYDIKVKGTKIPEIEIPSENFINEVINK